jgi:putative membrane protein
MGHVGFGFGWLFFLIPLFWIGLFALIFGVFGRRWRRRAWAANGQYGPWAHRAARGAESTLAERFANGDIDEKEYRARLEVLRANNYPTPPTA